MSRVRTAFAALLSLVPVILAAQVGRPATNAAADLVAAPVGVSPGSLETFAPAAGACPTFSWTAASPAAGYALRVFRVGDNEAADAPAIAVELPAGASSWTPPGDACLTPAARYAWSVRALGEKGSGPWSEALLFEVGERLRRPSCNAPSSSCSVTSERLE